MPTKESTASLLLSRCAMFRLACFPGGNLPNCCVAHPRGSHALLRRTPSSEWPWRCTFLWIQTPKRLGNRFSSDWPVVLACRSKRKLWWTAKSSNTDKLADTTMTSNSACSRTEDVAWDMFSHLGCTCLWNHADVFGMFWSFSKRWHRRDVVAETQQRVQWQKPAANCPV